MTDRDSEVIHSERLTSKDLKGDLHFHLVEHGKQVGEFTGSHDSTIDGEGFINWASEHLPGMEYVVITDHLEGFDRDPGRFNEQDRYGVEHLYDDTELVELQLSRIAALNQHKPGFRAIPGIEASIQRNGTVNASDRVLNLFDVVIASDHYYEKGGTAEEVTRRYLTALENPLLDILGHPARRHPEWEDLDWEAITQKALSEDKAIEVSMTPVVEYGIRKLNPEPSRQRQFLETLARSGVKISIGGDTHRLKPLQENSSLLFSQSLGLHKLLRDLNGFGFQKSQVLNTYSADQLVAWARGNNQR